MANETIKLLLEVDTKNSLSSLNGLEERLSTLKERIKNVEVGSTAFKALQKEIVNSEAQVKNLNKSFEGLDTEALAGEFGKFAGGITAGFTAISAVGGKSMEEVVQSVAKGMAIMQGIKGATEAWTSAQKLLNVVLAMNPIGLIVTAIGALIAVIGVVIAKGDGIKKMLTEWGEKFTFLQGPINVIKKGIDTLMGAWNKLSDAVKWALNSDSDAQKNIDKMRADFKKRQDQRDLDAVNRINEKNKKEQEHTAELAKQQQTRNDFADKKRDEAIANEEAAIQKKKDLEQGYFDLSLQQAKDNATLTEKLKQEQWNKELALIDAKGVMSEEDLLLYQQILQQKADSNQAYINAISEQEQAKRDYDEEIRQEQADASVELEDLRIENIENESDRIDAQYEKDVEINEKQKQLLVALFGENVKYSDAYKILVEQRTGIDNKYAENKKRLNKIISDSNFAELEAAAKYLMMGAELFNKNTAAYKIMATASIIISTALGAMKAFAEFGNPIIGGIAAGVVVAAGAVSLAQVNGVKFADGGVLNGPSHAQGGILTPFGEVEGGEGVINNRSMSNYSLRNMASAANVAGGGRNFSAGDGTIKLSPESIAMINDKKVYVSESDITSTQNKVKVYESNATY